MPQTNVKRARSAAEAGRGARRTRWRGRPSDLACVCWIAFVAAACTAPPVPPASVEPAGILLVEVGEKVQAGPPTEELKVVLSDLLVLAENNGDDLGYPWFDASTGEIVVSVVTPRGRQLIDAAAIKAALRIRSVAHGAAELTRIQDDVTHLRSQGVPGAELIYATVPDWRDNRAMIVISAPSPGLLDALAARYPADALAVQVNPAGAP